MSDIPERLRQMSRQLDLMQCEDVLQAADEIDKLRRVLEQAEEWLSGWASAEPYLSTIRAALGKSS